MQMTRSFVPLVSDYTLTLRESLLPFPEAHLRVSKTLVHDFLKDHPTERTWRWPWLIDRDRIYLVVGWLFRAKEFYRPVSRTQIVVGVSLVPSHRMAPCQIGCHGVGNVTGGSPGRAVGQTIA